MLVSVSVRPIFSPPSWCPITNLSIYLESFGHCRSDKIIYIEFVSLLIMHCCGLCYVARLCYWPHSFQIKCFKTKIIHYSSSLVGRRERNELHSSVSSVLLLLAFVRFGRINFKKQLGKINCSIHKTMPCRLNPSIAKLIFFS